MQLNDRYYKAQEEVTLRYYQVPKVLFGNERYKGLSLGAKMVYGILQDRLQLSIKNEWVDENGFIFLVFGETALAELLETTEKTARGYKKELVKYGLIVDKRLGQGKANHLYVLKPELAPETPKTLDMTENGKNDRSRTVAISESRTVKTTVQDKSFLPANETKYSDTEKTINNGWLGESLTSQAKQTNKKVLQEDSEAIQREWQLFKGTCEQFEIDKAHTLELWKVRIYNYRQAPITIVLSALRELMQDKYSMPAGGHWTKKEYHNLTGLFHHRMRTWREFQIALEDIEG